MKLKEAIRIARVKGFKWVAVDKNLGIYAFKNKPEKDRLFWRSACENYELIDIYNGSKHWTKTLREVN